jgi:hypothetical protein
MKKHPFKIYRHLLNAPAASLLATMVLATISYSSRADVQIQPGQGVSFAQVDFVYTNNFMVESNSDTGQILVSPDAVRSATGKTSGYINVLSPEGWVVHNLPLLADFSSSNILCAALKLPTPPGVRLSSVNANVQISDEASTNFSGPCTNLWPVGKTVASTAGLIHDPMIGPVSPPPPNTVVVQAFPSGVKIVAFEPGHPNVQAAQNQCWPCAVANSLQWLEDTFGIVVRHDNVPGIGITANVAQKGQVVPQNSLAGQLDIAMQRQNVAARNNGGLTNDKDALPGKLSYMANNGLGGMITKHQTLEGDMAMDITANNLTSTYNGPPSFGFILSEFLRGADVEMAYVCDLSEFASGHVVDVIGIGYNVAGEPYVFFVSDHVQTDLDRNDNQGTGLFDYSRIDGPDNSGYYHLLDMPNQPLVKAVVSEMPGPNMLNSIWGQLPGGRVFLNNTNAFGGDRASDCNWTNAQGCPAVADDFRSDGRLITAVRWWGSYLNSHNPGDEDGYVLSFFNDLRPTNTFSQPTNLLVTYVAPWNKLTVSNTSLVGLDGLPIYEYTVCLRDTCPYYYYVPTNSLLLGRQWAFLEQSNTIYWLAIEAERGETFALTTNAIWTNYPSGKTSLSEHFWGWHTSPCSNLDASVTGVLTSNLGYQSWTMNTNLFGEVDQAFELLTFAPPPAQASILINNSWLQPPDQTCSGIAVLATDGSDSRIVADDFAANSTKNISCFCIWGAWLNDRYDPNASFRLRIYSDVPAATNQPSHPGTKLWEKTFSPTLTNASALYYWSAVVAASNLCESFWDPLQSMGMGNATRDSKLYQYQFYMPTNNQFVQTNGQIYWLSVTALNTTNRFGWKTTITNNHYMDDAVFATQTNPPVSGWTNLDYPTNHPFAGQTMDMAFALTTPLVFSCSYSCGGIILSQSNQPESVTLSGSSTWVVDVGPAGEASDTDANGLDDVSAEIVQLTLSGTCSFGPVTVRIRDQNLSPYQPSLGRIEEMGNYVSNRLDVPPFAPSGYANSFFDVFLEVQIGTNILHSAMPLHLSATINNIPPPISQAYNSSTSAIQLLDVNGNPSSYSLQGLSYIPASIPPPVITGISIISPGWLEITWENGGGLQASPRLDGPSWTTIVTNSPYIGPITGMMQFYRVYQPPVNPPAM